MKPVPKRLLAVSVRPRPFSATLSAFTVHDGTRISEIVEEALSRVAPEHRASIMVAVGGQVIAREHWRFTKVRSISRQGHPVMVTIDPVPMGPGLRQGLLIAAGLAIAVGTAWIGGGGLAAAELLSQAAFGAGTVGAAAAAAAFGIAGTLALTALSPPPLAGNERQDKARPLAGVQFNQPAFYQQLTQVLGRMYVSPPPIATPYTKFKRGLTTACMVVGLAGWYDISEVKLNGADIDSFSGVTWGKKSTPAESRPAIAHLNGSDQGVKQELTSFDLRDAGTNQIVLENQSTPTDSHPQVYIYRSEGTPTELVLILEWAGLVQTDQGTGDSDPGAMPMRIKLKRKGGAWRLGPELHFGDNVKRPRSIRQVVRLVWQAAPSGSALAFDADKRATAAVWNAAPGQAWEYEADSYFDPGAGFFARYVERDGDDGFKVYLDPADWISGEYEIGVQRGIAYDLNNIGFAVPAYTYGGSATDANFFDHWTDAGTHKVRINQKDFLSTCYLQTITTFRDGPIVIGDPPVTSLHVEAKSLVIQSLSFRAWRRGPSVAAGAFSSPVANSNPASMMMEVTTGDANLRKDEFAPLMNEAALLAWHASCVTHGWECNAVIEPGMNLKQVMQLIAASGFAAVNEFEKYEVIEDRDRSGEAILQAYTPLNTQNFRVEREFGDIPHALVAEYFDEDDLNKVRERTVYAPEYNEGSATLFEGYRLPGFTHYTRVEERADFDLRQMWFRDTRYSFETGLENLRSPVGTPVRLAHDVCSASDAFSYVREVLTGGGGNVTGLRLEAEIDFAEVKGAAPAVWCGIRYRNGTEVVKEIVETTLSGSVTFDTPFANPGTNQLAKDCLVWFNPAEDGPTRAVVFEVEPIKGSDSARVVLKDEAPNVYWPGRALDVALSIDAFDRVKVDFRAPRQLSTSKARVWRTTPPQGFALANDVSGPIVVTPDEVKDFRDPLVEDINWRYWVTVEDAAGNRLSPRLHMTIAGQFASETLSFLGVVAAQTAARNKLYNDFVKALKAGSAFTPHDAIFLMAAAQAATARTNLVDPALYALVEQSSPTFSADSGYQSDGSSSYLSNAFNPNSSPGNKYDQNDAMMWVWITTAATGNGSSEIGNTNQRLWSRFTAEGQIAARANDATTQNNSPGGPITGFICWARRLSTEYDLYFNGAQVANPAIASTVVNNAIDVLRSGATFSTSVVGACGWGAALSDTQINTVLYPAVAAYMSGL